METLNTLNNNTETLFNKLATSLVNNLIDANNMETLVVLDYEDSSVNIYKGEFPKNIDTDKLLKELGHDENDCTWMFFKDIKINKYKYPLEKGE